LLTLFFLLFFQPTVLLVSSSVLAGILAEKGFLNCFHPAAVGYYQFFF